ncbi:MAG: asparagine synthase (glutamine-hydrolyzing) [Eubacterium sp.]|nr:asparagine synthase (glutamine-hydrolyzing) [Eubacterium sp.]
MCGIAGFYNPKATYLSNRTYYNQILDKMKQALRHRGPDQQGSLLFDSCGIAHTRLSILDLKRGTQPMTRCVEGNRFHIVYNGEIYNLDLIRSDLKSFGVIPTTSSDTETILLAFITFGHRFVKKLNGIFSIGIFDESHNTLSLFRDHFGVKPLYYTQTEKTVIFASEPKGCFCYPGIKPELSLRGLNEILALGPAHSPDCGVFHNFRQVPPGSYITFSEHGRQIITYFQLESAPHTDSYSETIEHTSFLVQDAVKRQMISDVPICTFLSGGIDSSVVSAICARELKKEGKTLSTFSFDFEENDKYFKANSFQPSQDRPYAEKMVRAIGSEHTFLYCSYQQQADLLEQSVEAHDLPCMTDIDSSMLHFCNQVSQTHKVVLTGECADEVFGGYPWFHREEFLQSNTFPWTPSLEPRKKLLSKELLEVLQMDDYVRQAYQSSIGEINALPTENEIETNRRRIGYLNIRYFMQTLLTRMDRTSMHSGLEARVPFADVELVKYVFNIPWSMKAKNGLVKNILRQASIGLVPEEILFRRKSPYPKSYNPKYEELLTSRLHDVLQSPTCKLHALLEKNALEQFLSSPKDYGAPWYGQLMAGPQMIAYLLQLHYFFEKYNVSLIL